MRTSINDFVDRRGGALTGEELDTILARARRLLADISAVLELESERLFKEQREETDEERLKSLKNLLAQTQKAWQTVIDLEARAGLAPRGGHPPLDLESARDEILRRLDRFPI